MKKYILPKYLFLAVAAILLISAGVVFSQTGNNQDSGKKVTVYKSPTCGCCVSYVAYLKGHGYDVDLVVTDDMDAIKAEHHIPANMQSCHTMIIDDYFVEGHVPLEAVDKLLAEQPDINGISLPAMPTGSPGMPGNRPATAGDGYTSASARCPQPAPRPDSLADSR